MVVKWPEDPALETNEILDHAGWVLRYYKLKQSTTSRVLEAAIQTLANLSGRIAKKSHLETKREVFVLTRARVSTKYFRRCSGGLKVQGLLLSLKPELTPNLIEFHTMFFRTEV